MRWQTLALLGLLGTTWLGCSGDDDAVTAPNEAGAPAAGNAAEGGTAASSGASTLGGSSGATRGSGGNAGRGGLAGTGGSGATAGSGGMHGVPALWTCSYSAYGDGKCDCGCGAPDSDCTAGDLEHCEMCNQVGSCSRAECPGRIDPGDVTSCLAPPAGWTCTPSLYGDGRSCDCGCGVVDADCKNGKAGSCDDCAPQGSCASGPCPASIAADDNARCEIPAGWTCTPATYGDGICHCGCGVVDVDCPDAQASSCEVCDDSSCWPLHCNEIVADDNAHCAAPPPAWNCSARLYRDGSRCDCGCGAVDPDCASKSVDACDKCDSPGSCAAHACPSLITTDDNAHCTQPDPPRDWTCPPNAYGDGLECDCGCGVEDIDCRDNQFNTCLRCLVCGGHGDCTTTVDPSDPTQCAPPPPAWSCSPEAWRDSICDCGCGVLDSFCQNIPLVYVCGNYPIEGCSAGNRTHIDPNHNYLCVVNVPSAWTCDRSFYDDGFCDCGCGAVDLDCPPDDASACEQCNDEGSCSRAACPGSIDPSDTAHCSE